MAVHGSQLLNVVNALQLNALFFLHPSGDLNGPLADLRVFSEINQ
jgi:hypothetical protein